MHSADDIKRPTVMVIPCYNEAPRLQTEQFSSALTQNHFLQFLFVNDGSRDGTDVVLEKIRALHPQQVSVLTLEKNSGKAEAVRLGFLAASQRDAAYIGYWDADLSTPLELIEGFEQILNENPQLLGVFGSRIRLNDNDINRHALRHFLARAFMTLANYVLGIRIYDSQCGAKLFRVNDVTIAAFSKPFQSRWLFDVEILLRLKLLSQSRIPLVREHPLRQWRDVPGTKIRLIDCFAIPFNLLRIAFRYRVVERLN